ncbi:hypothetical protein SprV_0301129600 [Sparganum proliferum]
MSNWSSWTITLDDRKKHDDRFQSLRPVSGYITGEQARNFFTQSKLPNAVLAQIWSLADLTNDGKLDKREFSIAMALIKKCLEGNQLPPSIPPGFLQEPLSSFLEPRKLSVTETPTTLGLATNGADSSEWSIPPNSRPKYRLQFNQNDRTKRGYLTGVEARGIFMSSHLPQSTLAYIWNLADIDNDGNLTCDEFCIAAYLIDQALAGRTLPPTLPPSLIPVQAQGQQVDPSKNLGSSGRTSVEQNVPCDSTQQTFEDKRMQNFLLGQAELDRRKQDLAEKLRQDEEARREQARLEAEKQEKLRLEQERRRQKEAEKEAEHQRNLEAQREARRQQATAAHIQALKEAQRQKALELEKARVEALAKERAAEAAALEQAKTLRASLLEAAASLATRRQTLEMRLSEVQSEYEGHRRAILEMGNRRDALERESVDLSERVEAGRAELHRWQREHEQLSLRVTTSVDANQASEHHKTLVNDLRQLNESKQQLEHRLADLNSRETLEGQTLASHRRRAKELEKTHASLVSEVRALRATLGDRQKAYREDKKRKASMAAAAAALTASATAKSANSSTLSSGPTETYVALYSYTPSSSDELAFTVGDKILVHKNPREGVGDGWLYGELNGKRGLVPATYVKSQPAHEIFPAAISDPFAPVMPSQTETGDSALVASATVDEDQKRLTSTSTPLFTCIALYDFKGHLPGDLSLKVGEKVNILNEKDGWYEGVSLHSHQSGMFPANYVEKLPSTESSNSHATNGVAPVQPTSTSLQEAATYPTSASTTAASTKANQPEETAITVLDPPELAIVENAFTADGVGQLTLVAKQYVKVQRKSASGWWEGEIQQRGQDRQVGWFPASCVRVVSSTSKPPVTDSRGQHQVSPTTVVSAPTTTTTTENKSLVQAKYAYKAAQPDELTFEENALIEVLNQEEEGWWRGRLTASGVEGLFPVNYVQPYNNAAVDGTSGGQFGSPKTAAASSSAPKPC